MLPIPISPMPRAVILSALARAACSMPAAMAASASGRVIASSTAMFPVPGRTFRSRMPTPGTSAAIPTSTTATSSPKAAAMADIPVLRRVMLMACCKVTDRGAQDTPSSTTPLSAANTTTRQLSIFGHTWPVMPARRMAISSSAPKLPGGLASSACRFRAASITARSAGRMACIYCCNAASVMSVPRYTPAPPASAATAGRSDFQW